MMKKVKKILALFTSGVICAVSVPGISANARAIFNNEITAPEGYAQIDDQGTLKWLASDGKGGTRGYIVYQRILETEMETWLYLTNLFRYNYTELVVPVEAYDTYAAIYAEYETELDFEFCRESQTTQDTMTITLFDEKTEDGAYSVDPADYLSKENTLITMCARLQEAGALESAEYSAVFTISEYGSHNQIVNIGGIPAGETDALQTIVAEYDADGTVTYADEKYQVSSVENYEDYVTIAAAVSAVYPEATVEMDLIQFQEDAIITEYGAIDLLTAEPESDPPVATGTTTLSTGDIDGDGDITLQDAYQALVAYASASAGLEIELTGEQQAVADVDGDGEITIADAFKILIYYATESVGRTPSWD